MSRKIIPCGEYGYSFPCIEEDNQYLVEITDEEFEKLILKQVKWEKQNDSYILVDYDYQTPRNQVQNSFKILILKDYLCKTDYIITKMQEAIIDNDMDLLNSLKQIYAEQLQERKKARAEINELEQQ